MKNIIINKHQEKLLSEAVQQNHVMDKVSKKIKHDIDTDNTPLSNLPMSHSSNKIAISRVLTNAYFNAKNNFTDNIEIFSINEVINKLDKLTAICQKKEEKIHTELEKLCVDIATSYFNIDGLEDVTLECKLVNDLSNNEFHIEPNTQTDVILNNNENDILVNNRKFANVLSMGGALSLYDKLQDKFINQLFKLDEDLPHLYSKILKINEYLTFVTDDEITDSDNHQTGCVKVTLDSEQGDKISAVGTLFPFLLIETFRGYLELLSDVMLPDNETDFNKITEETDVLVDEPWYMLLGRYLWEKIVGDNEPLQVINQLFAYNCEDFNDLFVNVVADTDVSKDMLKKLYNTATYNYDYNNFIKDLAKKREITGLLSDDELIDEAVYPDTFNLDEFKGIRSFAEKVRYCKQRLTYLGKGRSRIVFQIDENTVLKLAYNKKGIAQNESESRVKNDYYLRDLDLFAEVYDVDDEYLWLEMESARKAKSADFKKITGYGFRIFYYWLQYCYNILIKGYNEFRFIPEEYHALFKNGSNFYTNFENSIFAKVEDYIRNYDVEGVGDLQRISSWGVVKDNNGNERLVLIDNGLSNEVIEKYY